jgi:hypothetical protein
MNLGTFARDPDAKPFPLSISVYSFKIGRELRKFVS